MSRPYDDADDLQEREMYLRDRGLDHEENECRNCGKPHGDHRYEDNACPRERYRDLFHGGYRDDQTFENL
jgi:hypothetical protein